MYKVVDGQICLLSAVDKKAIDTRVQNAVVRIANIDNQLRTLLEQKQKVFDELADLKEVLPVFYSEEAKKIGFC